MEEDTIHTADDLYQEIADFRPESDEGNVEKFLEELAALSQKYNIIIDGCGCHGSPWLESIDASLYHLSLDHLAWNRAESKYTIERGKS